MKEQSSIVHLARHAMATMPDSLASRRLLLEAVVRVLPMGEAVRSDASLLLEQLAEHDRTLRRVQSELPLLFTANTTTTQGPR